MRSQQESGALLTSAVVLIALLSIANEPARAQTVAQKPDAPVAESSSSPSSTAAQPAPQTDPLTIARNSTVPPADMGVPPEAPNTPDTPDAPQTGPAEPKPYLDIYGFAQFDLGYDFRVNDPNWYDVNRPSKLPSTPGEFGKNGNTWASVRQTRFGVQGSQPTSLGDLKYRVEFDMFGVGVDAGQTTIRPRHYYGELGPILAGQTNSAFMDVDVFPNILDYWGPDGMIFLRNPQLRWTPIRGNTIVMIALEKPGASGDAGVLADRIDLSNVKGRFQYPDLTGGIKHSFGKVTYIRAGGVVRSIKLDNLSTNNTQSIIGWGVNVSSNIQLRKDVLRLQYVYGQGIENYMNDAPVDVAPIFDPNSPVQPLRGRAIPMYSFTAYLDHNWSEKWTSALGYSQLQMQNTSLQTPDAFHLGQYASANLLCSPIKNFLTGGEFQFGRRTNMSNNYHANDYRVVVSFKYSFDFRIVGAKD